MEIAVEAANRLAEVKPHSRKELRATFVQLAFESPKGSPDRHELGGGEASNV
jgi:DNA-directed RNA polymerase subunit F